MIDEPGGRSLTRRQEWYADGLRFRCTQCGNCCTGPPGAVWFSPDEGRRIAERLGLDEQAFLRRYARSDGDRRSLIERETEHGFDCVFLDRSRDDGKVLCSIYEDRPAQCRSWPFWPENLESSEIWVSTKRITPCPGMNSGSLVPVEQIRILRDSNR